MMSDRHPAVLKCQQILKLAKVYGWTPNKSMSGVGQLPDGKQRTTLAIERNDEGIVLTYHDNTVAVAAYTFMNHVVHYQNRKPLIERIEGWPRVTDLFKWFPSMNRPLLVVKYRRLPFDENDTDANVLDAIVGHRLHWYNRIDGKIYDDIVIKSNKNRIQPVHHRRMLHLVCRDSGFRSVMLDQILQVD